MADVEEVNCGLALDFHLGDNADHDLRRKADFLRHLIDEPAFSTLRTREQLGYEFNGNAAVGSQPERLNRYIVATLRWTSVGTTVLRFRIQSQQDPVFLEERIETFLRSFFEQLKVMPDEDFDIQRMGVIIKKLERAKNLAEEAEDYWSQIRSGYYDFSQSEFHDSNYQGQCDDITVGGNDAAALESVTKAEILEMYEGYLLQTGAFRRTLAVHTISRKLEAVLPLQKETVEIVDIHAFKSGLNSTLGATPVTPHAPSIPDGRNVEEISLYERT